MTTTVDEATGTVRVPCCLAYPYSTHTEKHARHVSIACQCPRCNKHWYWDGLKWNQTRVLFLTSRA